MRPIGDYNPFPHVIAESGIEHVPDCPGCAYSLDLYEFTMRILDRLEEDERGTLLGTFNNYRVRRKRTP